jgi:ATP-dependent DNA helicase RecG
MQLGWFDELGSGMLNVNKYIKFYSGKDNPQFIERTASKTIILIPACGADEEVLVELMREQLREQKKDLFFF